MTECVAAIDQGTQSTRVFIFNGGFQPVGHHQVQFQQINPQAGWVEHDPLEIWLTVRECLTKAVQDAESKLGPVVIKALGITNQRETTVVWHKHTGQPLCNAIVWLDGRTSEICSRMQQELGGKDFFRPVTGLPISTYFSGFKFKWMYENVTEVREAVDADLACFGTIDSWLIYQLTGGPHGGVHVTDVSNASRTMLMDLSTCTWHAPFFSLFNMRPSALPRIVSNAEVYGTVSEGQLKGVPISGCLGDQMAAVLGQRCVKGEAKNTYGTGCFMLLNTGPQAINSTHGLLTTISFKLGPDAHTQYALEGAVAVAGLGISWLKDKLNVISSPEEAESLAAQVSDTGGVYFVPAFSGLLAPHWDDSARGAILGISGFTTRAHIVRAMLEAICFQTREVLDAMRKDADLAGLRVLRVDGGATKNNLLMQLQADPQSAPALQHHLREREEPPWRTFSFIRPYTADLLQVPVLRPHFQETTCLGAALAAGIGAGLWGEEQVFGGHAYSNTEFRPQVSAESAEQRYSLWKSSVGRALGLASLGLGRSLSSLSMG